LKAQAMKLQWVLMWWPRYLGVIQPALWIAAAILLLRLPTLALRLAVIGMVIVLNLGTFFARIHLDTDAPWSEAAADVRLAESQRGTTQLIGYKVWGDRRENWSPAQLVESIHGRYYWCLQARVLPIPEDVRSGQFNRRFRGQYTIDWKSLGPQVGKDQRVHRLTCGNVMNRDPNQRPSLRTHACVDWGRLATGRGTFVPGARTSQSKQQRVELAGKGVDLAQGVCAEIKWSSGQWPEVGWVKRVGEWTHHFVYFQHPSEPQAEASG
ncbi:MAG: hypothetical protein HC898_02910, partial [Phycisphaerales bacterium]|nr:hypothetical protein [Phycisphaerales bacterium]